MSQLDDVAAQDNWRCWVCDEPVDKTASVNGARGPSLDNRGLKKGNRDVAGGDRLAHRACNTGKGAVTPVIPWPAGLSVVDPAPLLPVAERLARKGGREVVARCSARADARRTADWLVDRLVRLAPALPVTAAVEPGGGQFLVSVSAQRRR